MQRRDSGYTVQSFEARGKYKEHREDSLIKLRGHAGIIVTEEDAESWDPFDAEIIILLQVQDYKEGTPDEKTFYIELWDVGGSVGSASSVKSTRAVFYNSVNGKYL